MAVPTRDRSRRPSSASLRASRPRLTWRCPWYRAPNRCVDFSRSVYLFAVRISMKSRGFSARGSKVLDSSECRVREISGSFWHFLCALVAMRCSRSILDFLRRKSLWKSRSQTRREEMFFARPSLSLLSFSLYRSFRPSRGLDRTKETIRTIKTAGTLVVAQRAVEAHGARAAVVAIIGGSSAGSLESPAGSRRLARCGCPRWNHASRLPSDVRLKAQAVRETAQHLVKQSQELMDNADVLTPRG